MQRQERLRIQAAEEELHSKRQAAAEIEIRAAELAQQHQALALVSMLGEARKLLFQHDSQSSPVFIDHHI